MPFLYSYCISDFLLHNWSVNNVCIIRSRHLRSKVHYNTTDIGKLRSSIKPVALKSFKSHKVSNIPDVRRIWRDVMIWKGFWITGLLWGGNPPVTGGYFQRTSNAELRCFFFRYQPKQVFGTNSRVSGDLRRRGDHMTSRQYVVSDRLKPWLFSPMPNKICQCHISQRINGHNGAVEYGSYGTSVGGCLYWYIGRKILLNDLYGCLTGPHLLTEINFGLDWSFQNGFLWDVIFPPWCSTFNGGASTCRPLLKLGMDA